MRIDGTLQVIVAEAAPAPSLMPQLKPSLQVESPAAQGACACGDLQVTWA